MPYIRHTDLCRRHWKFNGGMKTMDKNIDQLALRYREAWLTARRLPSGVHLGHTSGWPEMIFDQREQIRRAEREVLSVRPTPEDEERMLECIRWLAVLVDEDRKLIWLRASGLAWRAIAQRTGLPRSSVHRRWHRALLAVLLRQSHG
jgi:DNA-directed RNA polymerase specialized sigma24 family protein